MTATRRLTQRERREMCIARAQELWWSMYEIMVPTPIVDMMTEDIVHGENRFHKIVAQQEQLSWEMHEQVTELMDISKDKERLAKISDDMIVQWGDETKWEAEVLAQRLKKLLKKWEKKDESQKNDIRIGKKDDTGVST